MTNTKTPQKQTDNSDNNTKGNVPTPVIRNQQYIAPLTQAKDYRLWVARVKPRLQQMQQWDDTKNLPKDNQEATNFLVELLSNNLLEIFLDTNYSAPIIWTTLSSKFLVSSLSTQSTAFTALINFNYSQATMAENKLSLLSLARDLRTSFKNLDSVPIDQVVMLFALINVPMEYHALRSTLEETHKTGLTIDDLFTSLEREEAMANSSVANRMSSTKPTTSETQCLHGRLASTCWSCDTTLKPTCTLCKSTGFKKFTHPKGSRLCKDQQAAFQAASNLNASRSSDSSTAAAASSTPSK